MFHYSVVRNEFNFSGDGLEQFDLAVNPLSALVLTIRALNDTGTVANMATYLELCGALNRVSVLHRGVSVISMTGRDIAAMNYMRYGVVPTQNGFVSTNNAIRQVLLPVYFGRFAFDVQSCLPAARRGDLVLEVDVDDADTGYDGLSLQIDAIELLGASPSEFERKVQVAQTFAATGNNDVELPTTNRCRGLLLFGTTAATGTSPAPTWGRMEVRRDNLEVGYSSLDWETAQGLHTLIGGQPPAMDQHIHVENDTGGPTDQASAIGAGGWENYAFLDFDLTRDDKFSIDLEKATQFSIRADAEAANAVRVVPIERVPASAWSM